MIFKCHLAGLAFQKELPHGPISFHVPATPPLAHLSVIASLRSQLQGELLGDVKLSKHLSINDLLQPGAWERRRKGRHEKTKACLKKRQQWPRSLPCSPKLVLPWHVPNSLPFTSSGCPPWARPCAGNLEGARANQTRTCSQEAHSPSGRGDAPSHTREVLSGGAPKARAETFLLGRQEILPE